MDTPKKNRIGAPITGFEDSPVFNYINNLSPIKPAKSVHVVQIFHSLNFASPPSVFTSPHFNLQKDSAFLRRHQFSDLLRAESDDGEEGKTFLEALDAIHLSSCSVEVVQKVTRYDVVSADAQGKCDDTSSVTYSSFGPSRHVDENSTESTKEGTANLSSVPSQLASELPQILQYDFGSPKRNVTSCFDIKADSETVIASTPVSLVQFVNVRDLNVREGVSERQTSLDTSQPDAEVELKEACQLEQTNDEIPGCEWENLIVDGADDLLIVNSSAESEACGGCDQPLADQNVDNFSSLVPKIPENNIDEWKEKIFVDSLGSCPQNGKQDLALQPGEAGEKNDKDQTPLLLPSTTNVQSVSNPNEKTEDKSLSHADHCITIGHKSESQLQRGMRRRCLVFEAGTHKKSTGDNSNPNTAFSSATDGKFAADDKQLVPVKAAIGPQHMIANIGLHLNSLATHSKDGIMVKQEMLASGKRLISMTSSVTSFHSLQAGQKPMNCTLASNPIQQDLGPDSNELSNTQNASRGSASEFDEQFHLTSPKKKRRLSNTGESEGCKRCNCKKSKCLKLYCECFAAGVYCVEPCSCQECFNKPVHEDTVLATRKQIESRNPLAFAPKVVRTTKSSPDTGEAINKTPASARHKRGCNCKKSSCHKKYCECFQGGVGCSSNCRCEGCKNVFGRKDGTVHIGSEEAEPEEEEVEACDKAGLDENLAITEINKDEQHCSENRMPSFQICRSSVKVPFFSHSKPPQSILASCKTALLKSGFPHSQPKPEKHFQIVPDDDTPEILRANGSPNNCVKVSSPNQKRVSPPHNGLGWSPGRKSSRKLLLQSIPPFPSLTPHCHSRDIR